MEIPARANSWFVPSKVTKTILANTASIIPATITKQDLENHRKNQFPIKLAIRRVNLVFYI